MAEKETKKDNTAKSGDEKNKPTPVPLVDTYSLKKGKKKSK